MPLKAKLVWMYVLDNCDHCGVWHCNFKLLSFQIGETVTRPEFNDWFADKVRRIADDKFLIPSFIDFQYGQLNPSNNAHKAVIELLQKLGPQEVLISPSLGAQDKDKDKDQDQDKEKGLSEKKSVGEFEQLYRGYPLKKGKTKGLKACHSQIKTPEDLELLAKAIGCYRAMVERDKTEPRFIKHFDTFMGCWRDYIDEDVGTATVTPINEYRSTFCGIAKE